MDTTKVIDILNDANINFKLHDYTNSNAIVGFDVAKAINEDPKRIFKTVVVQAPKNKNIYIFMIPMGKEVQFKKARRVVGEKAIGMLKGSELEKETGYIHGGCSPIGTIRDLPVVFDEAINDLESVLINGGKQGYIVELKVEDLKKVLDFQIASLI